MSLDMLIAWVRSRGPRAAALLAVGLVVEWLCVHLAATIEQRLAPSSAESPAASRLRGLMASSVRAAGLLALLTTGAAIALDIAGLSPDLAIALDWLRGVGVQVGIVLALALFAARVVSLAAQYAEGAVVRRSGNGDLAHRARTVGAVARNFGLAAIAVIATLMVLAAIGVDTAPLLASAGIVGVAIGFGAQTLVRDLISGMFILVEDQFAVGDVIQVGSTSGTVERMTVRATIIREFSGTLHVIPNGEIRQVANITRDWSRSIVDVVIGYDVPVERALDVMRGTMAELATDAAIGPRLLEAPQVLGVERLAPTRVVLRTCVMTKPGEQWAVSREANLRLRAAFEREGLSMGVPPCAALPD